MCCKKLPHVTYYLQVGATSRPYLGGQRNILLIILDLCLAVIWEQPDMEQLDMGTA